MGKIGIITYFDYINYGSMLQGYATQQAINKVAKTPEASTLIDYRYIPKYDRNLIGRVKARIRRLSHYIKNISEVYTKYSYRDKMACRIGKFNEFRDSNICMTEVRYQDLAHLESNVPDFDVYVTGSDQTWNPRVYGGYTDTPMFLQFAPDRSLKCAYAPSLGVTEFSNDESEFLKAKLKDYKIITCRETLGAELLRKITGYEVIKVLDPTLLLTGEEWRKICVSPSLKKGSYILCYFLGSRNYYRDFAQKLSKKTGLPLYFIPVSWKDCKSENNLIFDAGPKEFIGLIDNAAYVLTDSFHGTAFCINLNTTFFSFVKHCGGISSGDNSRLYDMVAGVGLENRLMEKCPPEDTLDLSEIDFENTNRLLDVQRAESYAVVEEIVKLGKYND